MIPFIIYSYKANSNSILCFNLLLKQQVIDISDLAICPNLVLLDFLAPKPYNSNANHYHLF